MKKKTYLSPKTLTRTIVSDNILTQSATIEGGSNPPSDGGYGDGTDAAAKGCIWGKNRLWEE